MKKLFLAIIIGIMMLSICVCAQAELEKSPLLDAAFTMIERDNIFQRRYNELTGSNVESLFELGVPYFFGGQKGDNVVSRYPDYLKAKPLERTKFYSPDKVYIYGFDCSGFTNWIRTSNGLPKHDGLQQMILTYAYKRADVEKGVPGHIYNYKNDVCYKPMPPYGELYKTLRVGDLLVGKHGARHIMMYIGTLRDFGFTAEEVPELAEYLDYPLVIHCGPNPSYMDRFQKFLDETTDEYYSNCVTTNGGVAVSIIGVPPEAAPYHRYVKIGGYEEDFNYFMIDGGKTMMTIWDLPGCTSFCWFRM